jgi:hypothetical protein
MENKMSIINNKIWKMLFRFVVVILMCRSDFLNSNETDDYLYLHLKNIVANMPSKHNVTPNGYIRNALRLAMLLDVNYENFYIEPKEYPVIKKVFKDITIKNILFLIVIEKFEKKGTLYYGFLEENEKLHDAMHKILTSENGSYKIELDTKGKVNWLSRNTYAMRLSYPNVVELNENFGSATIALTGMFNEISIIRVGVSGWEKYYKFTMNPDTFVHQLYNYAIDDFIKKTNTDFKIK